MEMAGLAETIGLSVLVGASALTDLCRGKVFNRITVPAFLMGLCCSAGRAGAAGLLEVLCAAGFTLVVLFPFFKAGGLGAGDIKLLMAVAAFLPSGEYLRCFAGAFVIGAIAGLAGLLRTRGKEHTVHFALPVAASVLLHLAGVY